MANFFAKNLKYLRDRVKGVSQNELAEALGVGKSAISAYERGDSEPTLGVLIKIIRYFGVTFSDITELDMERDSSSLAEPGVKYRKTDTARLQIENETLREALREIGRGIHSK